MSGECLHSNNLERGGTSRQQRLLDALLPDYIAVDERDIEDLKSFVKAFAEQIRFYKRKTDIADLPTWEEFFENEVSSERTTDPHYALFLAFLRLFKIAQDDLNQITRKHLDFYYRDVLQLKEKKATADQAFIIFELAKHVQQHLISEDTRLKGGKDDSGNELIYETNSDIVLNKASVADIKACFRDKQSRIYSSHTANSADGQGAEIETAEMNWRTFGKPDSLWPDNERPQAEIGFAIASPLLFMAEGVREITITISLRQKSDNKLSELLKDTELNDLFRIRFSGEKDWIEADSEADENDDSETAKAVETKILSFINRAGKWQEIAGREPATGPVIDDPQKGYHTKKAGYDIGKKTAREILKQRELLGSEGFRSLKELGEVKGVGEDKLNDLIYTFGQGMNSTRVDTKKGTIEIKRTLNQSQDPVVTYVQNEDKLTDPFITEWPVMKCTLRTDSDPYQLIKLEDLVFQSINLHVNVSDVRELVIQNDQSLLDPGKDFQPFGLQPVLGSSFYVGSREVFSKQLDSLSLDLVWHGLPEDTEGFGSYYSVYGDTRTNESFQTTLHLLDKKQWVPLGTEGESWPLFSANEKELKADHRIEVKDSEALPIIKRDPNLKAFTELDTSSLKGFLKLELSGTNFGHKEYQAVYTKTVMGAFQDDGTFNDSVSLPNEPYTPLLKEIKLSYESSQTIWPNYKSKTVSERTSPEQFFHVGVFGVSEKLTGSVKKIPYLFPHIKDEGSLYIGLSDFESGQTLSLLFQVAEGSADPDLEPQTLEWHYLSDDKWIPFSQFDILADSTTGLLTSGIIKFSVPKQAGNTHSLMPTGKHWLKATVPSSSEAVSDLIQITAQAVTATFKDNNNDPGHLENALPAKSISKLKEADSAIRSVTQPFSSFGGAVEEKENNFYTRVSERLRHKQRAITIWDYERIVLEAFPSVFKVKCLNHTRFNGSLTNYSELAPGHVTLIVISNVQNKNAVDPLRPKTSLIKLTQIRDYLMKLNSPCVELHVKNPIYEEIEVSLNVKFYSGFDNGFYGKQLEDDIKSFLSPWAYESTSELELGGKIHQSVILNFVEERSYVDFLTCFEMWHIIKDPATDIVISRTRVDEAEAGTSVSILGSVGQDEQYGDHKITVLETDDCSCDSNEVKTTAAIASVDDCGSGSTTSIET